MAGAPADVSRVVETALGCSVLSCTPATDGRMAETHLLELDGEPGRAVCKVGGPSVRTGDVIEPFVVRLVGSTTDVPVPTVLASGQLRGQTGAQRHWALYEFCDGEPPTPFDSLAPAVRRRIVAETGSALGRLHAAHQFERIGGLSRAGEDLEIREPNGLHVPERGRRLLRRYSGPGDLDPQPVLTHGDLFPGNLLADADGRITAFLDWGNAHVTTAGYALARAEMRFIDWFRFPARERASLRRTLRTGYRDHRPLPPDYPRFARLYKLLWLTQSGERLLRHTLTSRGRRQLRDHLNSLLPAVLSD